MTDLASLIERLEKAAGPDREQSMMKRVAQAVRSAWDPHGDVPFPLYDGEAEAIAHAAIQAMREPTRKMLHAASKAMSPDFRPTPNRVSVRAKHAIRYRAMIDAALPPPKD